MWCYIVGWMQEGRKCIFVILWEKQFCAQISFVFHCFLTTCFVHKNVNTLSWDLSYGSKCVILHVLSISTTNSISPKMSLTTFLHSHDDIGSLRTPWIRRCNALIDLILYQNAVFHITGRGGGHWPRKGVWECVALKTPFSRLRKGPISSKRA